MGTGGFGLIYRNPNDIKYRYMLEGGDREWQHTKSRTARYPLLPPGEYRFRV